MKRYIVLLMMIVGIIFPVSASTYRYNHDGQNYVASIEGGGVINPTLSFNMSNGYLIPDNPNNTYTVIGTIESYDTQAWEGTTGGAYAIMVDTNPQILTGNNKVFKQWYNAGTPNAIGYAESLNGINWTKYSGNPLTTLGSSMICANFMKYGDTYYSFRTDTNQMDVFSSQNGLTWTKIASGIIHKNSTWGSHWMWYDYVWVEGSTWYMLYPEATNEGVWTNGLATASAPEGPWKEYDGNPVLKKEGGGQLGWPMTVYKDSKGYYWVWIGYSDLSSVYNYQGDASRYRTKYPNNLTEWVQDPRSKTYIGESIIETPENYHRQEGWGIMVRYNNTTYIYGDYAVKNYQNSYKGDTHLGLITTPLSFEQLISTDQKYPDMKAVMGI